MNILKRIYTSLFYSDIRRLLFFSLSIATLVLSKPANGQFIYTVAGNGIAAEFGDGGQATVAELHSPNGIALDDTGNIYVSDNEGYTIRKIELKTGIISTYAGSGKGGFGGDGGPATAAKLLSPEGMTFDKHGNLYFAEIFNQRIRKVSPKGIISTYVGTGSSGYSGDSGKATAATLNEPVSVSVDSAGNIYVVDELNNAIRRVTPAGIITTVAGNGIAGYKGDGGPATAAELTTPTEVAFDSLWNMYISDDDNRIRKVDVNTGIITTVAGTGGESFSGDGGPATAAEIDGPVGITLDKAGNLFIVDNDNSRIREVYASTGIINTVVGSGATGFAGDSGAATAAAMDLPYYMKLDGYHNLYFVDGGNNRVRMVTGVTGIQSITNGIQDIFVYPCPASTYLNISSTGIFEKGTTISLHSILGQCIWTKDISLGTRTLTVPVSNLTSGIYLISIHNSTGTTVTKKVMVQ